MNVTNANEDEYEKLQAIALEMFDKFVYKKTKLSKKELENELIKYSDEILKSNFSKDGIRDANIQIQTIVDTKGRLNNGGIVFNEFMPNKKPSIMYLNLKRVINGRESNGLLSNSTADRMQSITRYIETIQHEYRHYKQRRAVMLDEDKVGYTLVQKYMMAREFASREIKTSMFYRFKDNYKNQYIEGDARYAGRTEALVICKKAYLDLKKKIREGQQIGISLSNVDKDIFDMAVSRETNDIIMSNNLSFFKGTGNRNRITSNATELSVACNKNLLKLYPVLNLEYNKDGSRKPLDDIIKREQDIENKGHSNEEQKELYDMIYTDILVHRNVRRELIELTRRVGKEKVNKLLDRCEEYNRRNADKNKEELEQTIKDSKAIVSKSAFKTSYAYDEYIEDLNNKISKQYDNINNKIIRKRKIVASVSNEYKTLKEVKKSLRKENRENKLTKNVFRVIKEPLIIWQSVKDHFTDKHKVKETKPDVFRQRKIYDVEKDLEYSSKSDINLDEKKAQLDRLQKLKEEKEALLMETRSCYRESQEYTKSKEKTLGKSGSNYDRY